MLYTELTKRAMVICFDAHKNQKDKGGVPYVFHPFHVAEQMETEEEICTALLHDVVEDTKYTFEDLAEEGFSEEVISALRLLTHDKQTPYMEYVENICKSGNLVAINVKMNDLRHNLARGKEGGHIRCVEKHTVALAFIENYLANI